MKSTFGILSVTLKYAYSRNGTIYYQRAIPEDLQERLSAKRIKIRLDTKDLRAAALEIDRLNRGTEAQWKMLRASPDATPETVRTKALALLSQWGLSPAPAENDPNARDALYDFFDKKREDSADGDETKYRALSGSEYLSAEEIDAAKLLAGTIKPAITDALELYLRIHGKRGDAKFSTYTRRAFATLVAALGNKSIDDLSRQDAHTVVTAMQARGLATGSIRRLLNSYKAAFEVYFREMEITKKNPFSAVPIPGEGKDIKKRVPFGAAEREALAAACLAKDDDVRWIVAMLADTGARLAEIVGLALDDIVTDGPVPHIVIQVHPWRSLKNPGSARAVPLVGVALWAAERIKGSAKQGQQFAFPRYVTASETLAASASATVAKWIRSLGMEHTAHELRHTLVDRLREVQCPEDVRFSIGGWASSDVGNQYGTGYGLKVKAEWLAKIASPGPVGGTAPIPPT